MSGSTTLFGEPLHVINLGLASFAQPIRDAGARVTEVDWRPPAGGDVELADLFDRYAARADCVAVVNAANETAVQKLLAAQPTVIGIAHAGDVIPGMTKTMILHAGPPVPWERMCGPMRGAVLGALLFEGVAACPEEAEELAAGGGIAFDPCHHHDAVGPMAGVVSASMPVWIVENAAFGNRAYCTLNEGLGKVLRYGAYSKEVIDRLRWMSDVLAPVLCAAIDVHGPVDLRSLIAQALQMGDEGHNRNRAGTSLLIRELAPTLVRLNEQREVIGDVLGFLHGNDHFFLNLTMPAGKCALDAAAAIDGSSLITVMARNGTEFGIRVSGTGDRWFVAPAPTVDGLYLPGFSAQDAAPDIGDSAITETAGYGGFAMAASPAIVQFVGGSPERALETTKRMRRITLAESTAYRIPALGFRGSPTGIDVLRVIETGIVPAINTGIAHKDAGVGMVGAGLVSPPFACFAEAGRALIETVERRTYSTARERKEDKT